MLGHQVAVSLLLDGELRGRLLELRADAANQARRLGSIPARAQIPRAPLGSRLAALASSGRSGRSGGSGWWRRGTEARLQRPRPRGSQPASARPASKARLYQPSSDQSERSRARPTVASIAQRSRAQRSEAQHSEETHAREGYGRSSTAGPGGLKGTAQHSENGPSTLGLRGGLRTARRVF